MSTIGTIGWSAAGLLVAGGIGTGVYKIAEAKVDNAPPDKRAEVRNSVFTGGMTTATLGVFGGIMGPKMFGFHHTNFGGTLQAVGGMMLVGGLIVAAAGSRGDD